MPPPADAVTPGAGQVGLLLGLLALLAVFIAYPLASVLGVAVSSPDGLTLAHFHTFFARALFVEALVNTLLTGVAACSLAAWSRCRSRC